jgi:hypothetical protein
MRTPAIAAALVAAALIVPASAPAKGVKDGKVCGTGGCVTVTDEALLMALVDGGGISSDPPQAAPFYEVTITMLGGGREESFTTQMLPSRQALRGGDGTWMELPAAAESALKTVAGDSLEPLPASQLEGAALPPARAPAPAPAPEPRGLSVLESILVLGALILIAAGFIAVGRGHRPALRRRPGADAAPSS